MYFLILVVRNLNKYEENIKNTALQFPRAAHAFFEEKNHSTRKFLKNKVRRPLTLLESVFRSFHKVGKEWLSSFNE